LSSFYLFFLFGTAAAVLGVMIDAMVRVSRQPAWGLEPRTFIAKTNLAGQAQADSTFTARSRPSGVPLPVNDEEWHLRA
jgi:hypothetical protein